jgi:hypothetical protein
VTDDQKAELSRLQEMPEHDLTFAAEKCADIDILIELSSHVSRIVREGVIYGLARLLSDARASDRLRQMSTCDESNLLREISAEALDP